ncbi:MAG: hypothetical protein Q4A28_00450 [Brachymonas sp.]|nr:hypothetical protein [Brachymonas sp.]
MKSKNHERKSAHRSFIAFDRCHLLHRLFIYTNQRIMASAEKFYMGSGLGSLFFDSLFLDQEQPRSSNTHDSWHSIRNNLVIQHFSFGTYGIVLGADLHTPSHSADDLRTHSLVQRT